MLQSVTNAWLHFLMTSVHLAPMAYFHHKHEQLLVF